MKFQEQKLDCLLLVLILKLSFVLSLVSLLSTSYFTELDGMVKKGKVNSWREKNMLSESNSCL